MENKQTMYIYRYYLSLLWPESKQQQASKGCHEQEERGEQRNPAHPIIAGFQPEAGPSCSEGEQLMINQVQCFE